MKISRKEFITVIILVAFGILSRTIFHINNNVEFITAFAISSAFFMQRKSLSAVIVIGIMFITDLIIGNSSIFIFTWSGFLVLTLLGVLLKNSKIKSLFLTSEIGAVVGTLIFFFWTNFGVVVLTNMYSKDLGGLIQSYQNGIPFLINQLVGNVIIVPLVFFAFKYFYQMNVVRNLKNRSLLN